jgi:hypothetical protein
MPIPNTFANQLEALPRDLGPRGNQARMRLAERGVFVPWGLTEAVRQAMADIGEQPHVRPFYPNDVKRFGTPPGAETWVAKHGGRLVMPLVEYLDDFDPEQLALADPATLDPKDMRIVGSGWVGEEPNEAKVTGQRNTFAERLSSEVCGQGFAADYAIVLVAGGVAMGAKGGVGCQTYESNHAGKAYTAAGFVHLPEADRPCMRPLPDGTEVPDVRQHYAYDMWMLNVPQPSLVGRVPAAA